MRSFQAEDAVLTTTHIGACRRAIQREESWRFDDRDGQLRHGGIELVGDVHGDGLSLECQTSRLSVKQVSANATLQLCYIALK